MVCVLLGTTTSLRHPLDDLNRSPRPGPDCELAPTEGQRTCPARSGRASLRSWHQHQPGRQRRSKSASRSLSGRRRRTGAPPMRIQLMADSRCKRGRRSEPESRRPGWERPENWNDRLRRRSGVVRDCPVHQRPTTVLGATGADAHNRAGASTPSVRVSGRLR
jgi:hypothetical protein